MAHRLSKTVPKQGCICQIVARVSEFREAHSTFATINFQYLTYAHAQNENEQLC